MTTYVMYQGKRVTVVGESVPMWLIDGEWIRIGEPTKVLIKFEGETRFHSLEVDRDELSDFEYESEGES